MPSPAPTTKTTPARRPPRPSIKHQIRVLLLSNRDGSFETQRNRGYFLHRLFRDLRAAGFKIEKIYNLSPKHIWHQVESWKCAGLGSGHIKNNLAFVRWLTRKTGRIEMVPTNDDLGVDRRKGSGEDKAWRDDGGAAILAAVKERSERLWLQMRLMRHFGLRMREACTLRPHADDQGEMLRVVNGTKGGRPRAVRIRTDEQRRALEDGKAFVQRGESMIETGIKFDSWRDTAKGIGRSLGLSKATCTNFHALRHRWAQEYYQEITGFQAPCRWSAEERAAATPEMVAADRRARAIVGAELGHGRVDVCTIYLGSPL